MSDLPPARNGLASGWGPGRIASLAVLLAAILAPVVLGSGYQLDLLSLVLINAMFLFALDLAYGQAGLAAVGHGAFLGIGTYVVGILAVKAGWPFWAAMPIAILVCAAAGLLMGLITLRLAGHYFVIASLALAIAVGLVVSAWQDLTGGALGLGLVPRPAGVGPVSFEAPSAFYWLLLAATLLVMLVCWSLRRSNVGTRLRSIRENPRLASALGVNIVLTRLLVLVISAALAGFAGAFQSTYLGFITPSVLASNVGFYALMALIIGGQRSFVGAVIGAAFFVLVPVLLQFSSALSPVFFGLALVVVILLAPDGVWGRLRALGRWVATRTRAARGGSSARLEPGQERSLP